MAQAVSAAFKAAPARGAAPRRARATHIVCARQGEAPLVRKGFPPRSRSAGGVPCGSSQARGAAGRTGAAAVNPTSICNLQMLMGCIC